MVRVKDNVGEYHLLNDCCCERDDGMGGIQGRCTTDADGSQRDEPHAADDDE